MIGSDWFHFAMSYRWYSKVQPDVIGWIWMTTFSSDINLLELKKITKHHVWSCLTRKLNWVMVWRNLRKKNVWDWGRWWSWKIWRQWGEEDVISKWLGWHNQDAIVIFQKYKAHYWDLPIFWSTACNASQPCHSWKGKSTHCFQIGAQKWSLPLLSMLLKLLIISKLPLQTFLSHHRFSVLLDFITSYLFETMTLFLVQISNPFSLIV